MSNVPTYTFVNDSATRRRQRRFGDLWTTAFTDPENPNWTIQHNGRGRWIMNHVCPEGNKGYPVPGAKMHVGKCCISCGNEWNDEFHGFYKLTKYGAETT